jgi:hypothetical protein
LELQVLGTDASGYNDSKVYDINDAGTSVGYALKYENGVSLSRHAVRWDAAGQVTELGHLTEEDPTGEAIDINEAGIIVGTSRRPAGVGSFESVAVYWDLNGNAVDLNTLIEPQDDWVLSRAVAISDSGWILGEGIHIDDPDGPGGQPGTAYGRTFMLKLPEAPDLPGDYNDDGAVDAADYVVWRKNDGTNATLPNDETPGSVGSIDYQVWAANFGTSGGGGATGGASLVPEPTTLVTILIAAVGILVRRTR